MSISVIIPTLNEAPAIEDTLNRLRHPAFSEILIVDGGSQDETLARAARTSPKARLLSSPKGRARQMNNGAAASTGEILLFLHADTLLPATAADDITAALQDSRIIGGRFDIRLDTDTGWLWGVSRLMNLRSRITSIATGDQALFVRKPVFLAVGGFPDIPIMEDIAFTRQLKQKGRIAALHSCVITSARRWARHGPIRTILLMWALRLLFFLGVPPARLKQWYPEIR
ncbi:MAG TPA: TIGR04283 family arsenosugar biosynthesis glycosyltransferase [Nitrospirales bacterium]|jgi:rSAM/selenodomain-associated transferase 2